MLMRALNDALAEVKSSLQALKRGRTVLAAIVPPSKEKPSKRRKSVKPGNRRVSFAPDDQLMTMHLYTKVAKCLIAFLVLPQ